MRTAKTVQTGQMPRLIWVFAGRTLALLVLSRGGSITLWQKCQIYSGFHSTMQIEHLCHANFLHRSDDQFKGKLQQMPLNTTWKKKHYINTYVQLQITVNTDLGDLFVWHRQEFAWSCEISLELANYVIASHGTVIQINQLTQMSLNYMKESALYQYTSSVTSSADNNKCFTWSE